MNPMEQGRFVMWVVLALIVTIALIIGWVGFHFSGSGLFGLGAMLGTIAVALALLRFG